jgi:hypothetical protein
VGIRESSQAIINLKRKHMATRKTTQQTELQQAGKQLSNAAKAVGTAVSHKFEAMGDAVSAGRGQGEEAGYGQEE